MAVASVDRQTLRPRVRRPDELPDPHAIHDLLELRALVDLAGRDEDGEGNSVTVSNHVDPAAESAARATQRVVAADPRATQRTMRRLEALFVHMLERLELIGQHPIERRGLGAARTVRCGVPSGARRGARPNRRPLHARRTAS